MFSRRFRNDKSLVIAAVIAIGGFFVLPLPSATATKQAASGWDAIGLAFAHVIVAEETKHHAAHGKYASDLELSKSGGLRDATRKMAAKFGPDLFRNWHWAFQIDTSANGQKYLLAIHRSERCQQVFFADQTGRIYEGKEAGCSQ